MMTGGAQSNDDYRSVLRINEMSKLLRLEMDAAGVVYTGAMVLIADETKRRRD